MGTSGITPGIGNPDRVRLAGRSCLIYSGRKAKPQRDTFMRSHLNALIGITVFETVHHRMGARKVHVVVYTCSMDVESDRKFDTDFSW